MKRILVALALVCVPVAAWAQTRTQMGGTGSNLAGTDDSFLVGASAGGSFKQEVPSGTCDGTNQLSYNASAADGSRLSCTAPGGAGSPWTSSTDVLSHSPTTDNVRIGAATFNGAKLSIDNDADEVAFSIQGHSTQTTNLCTFETSAGTDLFTISGAGNTSIGTQANPISGTVLDVYGSTGAPIRSSNMQNVASREGLMMRCLRTSSNSDSCDFQMVQNDSASSGTFFGRIRNVLVDNTDTSEDGRVEIAAPVAGTLTTVLQAGSSGTAGQVTVPTSVGLGIGAAVINSSRLSVDGDADQVQFSIQGHSTQTANLCTFENSSGTDLFTIAGTGATAIGTSANPVSGSVFDVYGSTTAPVRVFNSQDTAANDILSLRCLPATPTNADACDVYVAQPDSAAVATNFLRFRTSVVDNIDTTEDGRLDIATPINGTMTNILLIGSGGSGAGTVNVQSNSNLTVTDGATSLSRSSGAANAPLTANNTSGGASVLGARIGTAPTTPAANDYVDFALAARDSTSAITDALTMRAQMTDVTDATEDSRVRLFAYKAGTNTNMLDIGSDGTDSLVEVRPNVTLRFEGATDDGVETLFVITDPLTSDKSITFQNATGTVVTDSTAANEIDGRSLTINSSVLDADQELYEQTKCINIDPTNATTDWFFFRAERAITVIGIDCIVAAATSVVMTLRECDANGGTCGATEAAITCGTTNTTEATSIDDSAVDAGDWMRVLRGTVSGTPGQATLCVTYTVND